MTEQLTDLQKRILTAALLLDGRLIVWVIAGGRVVSPRIQGDAADGLRALEGAGLLALDEIDRKQMRGLPARPVGSHVFHLTEAGERAARRAVGRPDSAPGGPAREADQNR